MPLLFFALLLACGGPSGAARDDDAKPADPRTLVEVADVTSGTVGLRLVASAVVESVSQASVIPQAQGIVTKLLVEEGDSVRKGELLAVLESPQLDGAKERAEAEADRAAADLATAERLHGQGALSATELAAARQASRMATLAAQESRKTAGHTRLVAPIAGTVATRAVRFGELAAGQPAFTIVDPAHLRVVVALPERDLARVEVGQTATVTPTSEGAAATSATVARVAPVVDPATGTFRVTLELAEGSSLRPGQFVRAHLQVDAHTDVTVVPRRALAWEDGVASVYVVRDMTAEELAAAAKREDDAAPAEGGFALSLGGEPPKEDAPPEVPGPPRKAVRVRVELGYEDGEVAEVVKGLERGEKVVIVGNDALRDGARVRLPGDPVSSPATTEAAAAKAPAP